MKLFFTLFIITTSYSTFGQKKSPPDFNCYRYSKFSPKQKQQYYPFNTTSKVVFVSFEESESELNYKNKSVGDFKFKEVKILETSQIDSLIDLLYNISVKGNVFKFTPRSCYSPRNAILFLNSKNKIFEFIELCFECYRTRTSSPQINDGIACDQKFNLIRAYFKKQGIQYGTDNGL